MSARTPTPKVAAAGTSGAATVVLLWLASLVGLDLPEFVATAIVLLATVAAGYLKQDTSSPGRHAKPDDRG